MDEHDEGCDLEGDRVSNIKQGGETDSSHKLQSIPGECKKTQETEHPFDLHSIQQSIPVSTSLDSNGINIFPETKKEAEAKFSPCWHDILLCDSLSTGEETASLSQIKKEVGSEYESYLHNLVTANTTQENTQASPTQSSLPVNIEQSHDDSHALEEERIDLSFSVASTLDSSEMSKDFTLMDPQYAALTPKEERIDSYDSMDESGSDRPTEDTEKDSSASLLPDLVSTVGETASPCQIKKEVGSEYESCLHNLVTANTTQESTQPSPTQSSLQVNIEQSHDHSHASEGERTVLSFSVTSNLDTSEKSSDSTLMAAHFAALTPKEERIDSRPMDGSGADTEDTEEDSSTSSSSSSESETEDSSSSDSTSEDSSSSTHGGGTFGRGPSDSEDDRPGPLTHPLTTAKEVLPQDLPLVVPVDVVLDSNEELELVGVISSVIGQLVVVQSNPDVPALDCDTVLFREDRQAIGVIFEVFGPVSCPLYTVRFNNPSDIKNLKIELRMQIFFAPRIPDITAYVFTQKLQKIKGSDASWENDEEPPSEFVEYSDDEQERAAKNKGKSDKRKRKTPNPKRETDEYQQMRHHLPDYTSANPQGVRSGQGCVMRPRPPFSMPRGRGVPQESVGHTRHPPPPRSHVSPLGHRPPFRQHGPPFNPNSSFHGDYRSNWLGNQSFQLPPHPPPPPLPPPRLPPPFPPSHLHGGPPPFPPSHLHGGPPPFPPPHLHGGPPPFPPPHLQGGPLPVPPSFPRPDLQPSTRQRLSPPLNSIPHPPPPLRMPHDWNGPHFCL